MNNKFIEHGITFNNGDVIKQKSTDIKMVVVETEHGYSAPYNDRIICKYWHPTKNEFATDKFLAVELEISTS